MIKFLVIGAILFPLSACDENTTGPTKAVACEDSPFALNIDAPSAVSSGDDFEVTVSVNHVTGLVSAPFYLIYDPAHVSFLSAGEGNFLNKDGASVTFLYSNDGNLGRVVVGLSRLGDKTGVSGSGVLLRALFKAHAMGRASLDIENANLMDGKGKVYLSPVCASSVEII